MDYPISIYPLSEEDGGGYLAIAPDLVGCMSDGETPEEALRNGREAIMEWIETAMRRGLAVPQPGSSLHREREYRDHLLAQLRDVRDSVDLVEERLAELELAIRELQERQENEDAWSRFVDLASIPTSGARQRQAGNC